MANAIAKLDDLHIYFFDIVSELIVECVIGFGRFVRIFKITMKMMEKDNLFFNVEQNRVVCKSENHFSK
jgi:hypothetical protein